MHDEQLESEGHCPQLAMAQVEWQDDPLLAKV